VFEGERSKRPAQLAVDPREQVHVEPGRDAARVVVGVLERIPVLAQVDAHEEAVVGRHEPPQALEEFRGLLR
jgi:hypothetical protein